MGLLMNQKNKGFTLMEMLIVVTIIAILAAIVLPRFLTSSASAKSAVHRSDLATINAQLELYYFNTGSFPTAMTNDAWSAHGVPYSNFFPDGVPTGDVYGVAWGERYNAATGRIIEEDQ